MSETIANGKPRGGARNPTARPRQGGAGGRLVIVSNRVAEVEKGKSSSGGLAVAIQAALAEHGGIWFGWSGAVNDPADPAPQISVDGNLTYATLDLSQRDFNEYYIGYSNRVLWPLVHFRPDLIEFSRASLAGYLRVNRLFARGLAPLLAPQDLIWVHDYHLVPLAEELRRLDCAQPIGFFLHTPFPPAELLRTLPNHLEFVRALCAYDLIGFQSAPDLDGFRDYLLRWVGAEDLGGGAFRAFDRVIRAAIFPIGIDVDHVAAQAKAAASSRQTARLRDSLNNRTLMIGVDRLDYSKGLPARFAAYSLLLEKNSDMRGRIVFLQIASPSRSDVPEYRDIRRSLAQSAGNINGRYSEFDWTPLRYLNKSFNHRILTGFYRASRIALVTPRRDGMNLVAKEYVASQDPENPGMLVLSCFAGAAHELGQSILVNPYDVEGMAEAVRQGFDMPLGERKERWTTMLETLKRNDITAWRERFVEALSAIGARG